MQMQLFKQVPFQVQLQEALANELRARDNWKEEQVSYINSEAQSENFLTWHIIEFWI